MTSEKTAVDASRAAPPRGTGAAHRSAAHRRVPVDEPAAGTAAEPSPAPASRVPRGDTSTADRVALLAYLAGAFVVTGRLWVDPDGRMLRDNRTDQIFFEWVLTNAASTLRGLHDPFFTDALNAPHGINLMANTSIWGLALPLAPLTLLAGAGVSFAVLVTGALFATAAAWYYVLSRHVVRSPLAAFAGAGCCGFAPGMISQATGHPQVAVQFVAPLIVLAVLRLREPGRSVRNGLVLGLLVACQAFIGEELLLFTALGLLVFLVAYGLQRPHELAAAARPGLTGLGVTTVAATALLAYPLWVQFSGAQSYHGLPGWVLDFGADLATFPAYSDRALAGPTPAAKLAALTEQNTFLGWSLVVLAVFALWWLRRRPVVPALGATGLVFAVLALGRQVSVGGHRTGWSGPWRPLATLPLLDSVVPSRLALVMIPVIGVLLAMFLDALSGAGTGARRLALVALVLAVVPVLPTPMPVAQRPPTPRFFTSGLWHNYVRPGETVVMLPLGWYADLDAMRWQTGTGQRFRIAGGYFLAPEPGDPGRPARFGPPGGTARSLLSEQAAGQVQLSDAQREALRRELADWHADVLLLPDSASAADAVRGLVGQVYGDGWHIDDVWVWRLPDR
jgi:hypothetical protein